MLEEWVEWQLEKSGGLEELIWGYLLGIFVIIAAAKLVHFAYKLT